MFTTWDELYQSFKVYCPRLTTDNTDIDNDETIVEESRLEDHKEEDYYQKRSYLKLKGNPLK
eukprot:2913148-Ditylum_brightwellii.AAC.1